MNNISPNVDQIQHYFGLISYVAFTHIMCII